MKPEQQLAYMLDPSLIMKAQGLSPDPWQREVLLSQERQVLLNCTRQGGKSTVVAAMAIHQALFTPGSLILLLSPSQRQSHELFRKVTDAYSALGRPMSASQDAQSLSKMELSNGSRIIGLPGKEANIRSYSKVNLLVIDEASRVPDDLYRSVRPMLVISKGRLVAMSTPYGQRGWFYQEFTGEGSDWKKMTADWRKCPRITAEYIEGERRSMGDQWVRQEFECQFSALEGLVYPDFEKCLVDMQPPLKGSLVGGIDFGWRNPFAAIWGVLTRDGELWITGERYLRETPLHAHVGALKKQKGVVWYADPAGRTETEEMRAAGLAVKRGRNDIRPGIAAITARIQTGRLKIVKVKCPNLIAEAKLYRYPSGTEKLQLGENPIDDNNHALAALRYMVSRIDARFISKLLRSQSVEGVTEQEAAQVSSVPKEEDADPTEAAQSVHNVKPWKIDLNNEDLWE